MHDFLSKEELTARLHIAEAKLSVYEEEARRNEKKAAIERELKQSQELLESNGYIVISKRNMAHRQVMPSPTSTIDSILNVPAIKKEIDDVHCMIKDLHERCDQTAIKLLELKQLGQYHKPGGYQANEIKSAPPSVLDEKPRPEDWPVWSEKDLQSLSSFIKDWVIAHPTQMPGTTFGEVMLKLWKSSRHAHH